MDYVGLVAILEFSLDYVGLVAILEFSLDYVGLVAIFGIFFGLRTLWTWIGNFLDFMTACYPPGPEGVLGVAPCFKQG